MHSITITTRPSPNLSPPYDVLRDAVKNESVEAAASVASHHDLDDKVLLGILAAHPGGTADLGGDIDAPVVPGRDFSCSGEDLVGSRFGIVVPVVGDRRAADLDGVDGYTGIDDVQGGHVGVGETTRGPAGGRFQQAVSRRRGRDARGRSTVGLAYFVGTLLQVFE